MKLDKKLVDRRVKLMADEGIRFVTGKEIGKDIPADQLAREHEAVLSAAAPRWRATAGRRPQPGGIYPAMDFLQATPVAARFEASGRKANLRQGPARHRHRRRRYRHRLRGHLPPHGCRTLTQLEICAPPDERAADNPWPQWPKTYKLDYGQEEAKALWARSPHLRRDDQALLGDKDRHVRELLYVQVEWVKGPDGRFGPREIPGPRSDPRRPGPAGDGFVGPRSRC